LKSEAKGSGSDEVRVSSDDLRATTKQKAEDSGKEKAPSPVPKEDSGVWLVSETVQVPGVLLDIPCAMFRSKEQAQAYLKEQGEQFQLRRIEGDWNRGSDELRVETQRKEKEKA
jgi:hypothetical protein